MLRPTTRRPARRGVTLIVVLATLSLLAVVGLAAVYFAKDQAERARINGDDFTFADDGTDAANEFLAQLIYGDQDTGRGLLNAVRGISLMETMYGAKQAGQPAPTDPFVGPGTFAEAMTGLPAGVNLDRRQFVNHRLFPGMTNVYDPGYSNPGGRAPNAAVAGVYIGKHAPYTYPDVKDFYLAALCPATGEVLLPSYHRPGVFGSLDPTNPNWTNAAGKYLTPRPRPQEHPNFPPVPQNADGSRTGDVQNLPGGFLRDAAGQAIAKNDSIWIDIGLPPITLPGGRRVKPLVAALVLDMDGRLNLNMHGNRLSGGTAHASGQGIGPHEVSLEKAFGAGNVAEARNMVAWRGNPQARSGLNTRAFVPWYPAGKQLPLYAAVGWPGLTSPDPFRLPGAGGMNLYGTAPQYTLGAAAPYTDFDGSNDPARFPNHPSRWNPGEWTGTAAAGGQRAFPMTDAKLLTRQYAPYPSVTAGYSFAAPATAPNYLVGTTAGPTPNPPGQGTTNGYRGDGSHANRMIFATSSWGFDRPSLTAEAAGMQPLHPAAGLAPVNLSRPLADYRVDTTAPLSPGNVANAAAADADRVQLARDIFGRLVVAAGFLPTTATVDPATGAVTVVDPAQVDSLRQYAQIAVNIVDYVDSDDVSTRFEWYNPGTPEVVYGVEKPRLLLNEAYLEVVNDPTDPALGMANGNPTKGAHVRVFAELKNPSTVPHMAAADGPLGTGAVYVRYLAADGAAGAYSPYQLEVVRNNKGGADVLDLLRNPANPGNPANVTGGLGATVPDLTFDFSPVGAGGDPTNLRVVPAANGVAGDGIRMVAADVPAMLPMGAPDFNPPLPNMIRGAAPPAMIGMSADAMAYPLPLADAFGADLQNHVVLLRRLANPYLPPDPVTNPMITVDTLGHVKAGDRVLRKDMTPMNRMAKPTMPDGYDPNTAPAAAGDPDLRPQAFGKVDPYTAWSAPVPAPPPAINFPASLVLGQEPAMPGMGADGVRHTFGRQNSRAAAAPGAATFTPPATLTDTLMVPYDWLVHLDRPLINPLELIHVAAVKPHELTAAYVRPTAANDALVRHGHTVRGTVVDTTLYRALDLLRVQPFVHQAAVGGRVPGRINVNTMSDRRVLRALFDAPLALPGHNSFDEAFVDALWAPGGMMETRTRSFVDKTDVVGGAGATHRTPVPGQTVHDTGVATDDRPFLPPGVATVPPGGYQINGTATVFAAGVGIDDTLLRRNPAGAGGVPWLTVGPPAAGEPDHPYRQAEALRKILNNTTTTSNVFAVWVTVGYFEVESSTPAPAGSGVPDFVTLGREYYREAPGDARHKFFGFVDRTKVGLQAASDAHADVRPFFTTLEANVPAGSNTLIVSTATTGVVYADGLPVTIADGTQLVLGTGASQEVVTVKDAPLAGMAAGTTQVTLAVATVRAHHAGDGVSNVRPGNPGPQPTFDPGVDRYKPVVPLWGKVQ
ncbi:MAG: hypothetical protein C0501_28400 [Isosphaera sp.]|nr:hypothetical protein [Isosphaera sp.]